MFLTKIHTNTQMNPEGLTVGKLPYLGFANLVKSTRLFIWYSAQTVLHGCFMISNLCLQIT